MGIAKPVSTEWYRQFLILLRRCDLAPAWLGPMYRGTDTLTHSIITRQLGGSNAIPNTSPRDIRNDCPLIVCLGGVVVVTHLGPASRYSFLQTRYENTNDQQLPLVFG